MNIGGLTIEMAADLARLRQDMDDAKRVVGNAMDNMRKAADVAKAALGALGVGLGVAGFAAWVKGAIDAADAASKLAQKAGVAMGDVAGLQLAFELGGSSSQGMATAMGKLQKEIVEGNKAFDALGVKTRATDGTLRSSKDVLYDVADAIAGTENMTLKAARAQEIFGKSGAELLPLLNGGAQGFRDMAETAAALGLVIDSETGKAAEEFNDTLDLLQRAGSGVATQIAAKMLPALNAAAGGFLDMVKDGQLVDRMASGLVVTFKFLYTGVLGVIEVFSTLGKILGGTIARLMAEVSGLAEAVVKVFQGDFKGAAEAAQAGFKQSADISREMSADIKTGWQQTGSAISKTWNDTESTTVKAMAGIVKATKGSTVATKEQEDASAKAAEQQKKLTQAGEDYMRTLADKQAEVQKEIELGRKLNDEEKALLALEKLLRDGKIDLTRAQQDAARASIQHTAALQGEATANEAARKANEAHLAEVIKGTAALDADIRKQQEAIATMGLTSQELARLEAAKLRDAAASAERQAINEADRNLNFELAEQYRQQAAKLRELADLKEQGIHLKAAQEANEAWAKTTQEIGQGLTDSLFRAFESGKDFFSTFWDGIKNLFKTTVLKMLIQPVQQAGGNMLQSFMGSMGGAGGGPLQSIMSMMGGGGGGGGGGVGSILSLLGSAGSTFGSAAGSTAAGMMGFGELSSLGFGEAMSGGWSAMMGGNVSGGLGSMAGALGPIAMMAALGHYGGKAIANGYSINADKKGGIGAALLGGGAFFGGPIGALTGGLVGGVINRAFGRKAKETTESGIEGSFSGGDATGQTWANWQQKGGWFRSTKTGTDRGALNDEMSQALDVGAQAVMQQTKAWADALKLPADRLLAVTTSFKATLGQDEEANQRAVAELFERYQADLSASFGDLLQPFQKAGETLTQTLSRLAGIQVFSESINAFGGVFSRVASLSISAKEELLGFAGGIEAFVAKTRNFVDAYYTDAEKFGLQAKEVNAALEAMGINGASLSSRADFRALVEGQDLSTTEGRKQLDQLLTLAQAFAPIAQYLEQQEGGMSLTELAGKAPQSALLESVIKDQEVAAKQAEQQQASLNNLNGTMDRIHDSLERGFDRMVGELGSRFEAALAANGRYIGDAILETAQP